MDDMAIAKGNRYPCGAIQARENRPPILQWAACFAHEYRIQPSGGRELRSQIGLGGSSSSVDST